MPLPADRWRLGAERALRGLVFLLLGVLLVIAWVRDDTAVPEAGITAGLRPMLTRWTTVAAPSKVVLDFTALPALVQRDWLAALPGAGTSLSWRGESLPPVAAAMRAVAEPGGAIDLLVSAPPGSRVMVGSAATRIDSLPQPAAVSRIRLSADRTPVDVAAPGVVAHVALRDSLELRRVLVLGRAGWETRFIVAALEERGWQVDVHYAVAPFADIRQGVVTAADLQAPPAPTGEPAAAPPGLFAQFMNRQMAPGMVPPTGPTTPTEVARPRTVTAIDTARYAAVIAVDSSAAREGTRLIRYVRSGGGLLLFPAAAATPPLAALRVGLAGVPIREQQVVPVDSARSGLGLTPLVSLKSDALVLERRHRQVAVAARLEGAGRIVQVGYQDLWRWRMGGGATAPEQSSLWLNRLLASVAYAPAHSRALPPVDAAPLANLVERLGPPDTIGVRLRVDLSRVLLPWIFGLLCLASLLEWTSRRMRGAV